MAVNKVEFGNQTIMDITDTTADADEVIEGEVFYTRGGIRTVGTLGDATQNTHGLMSAADKTKLDGITSGAAVTDVQINSTSILNNGIANIPISSSSNLGVVKINSNYGITINESNELSIVQPVDAQIKLGMGSYTFITAAKQNMSVFYGLAKAAGDTTQALSLNDVGTYTDTAKAAIQTMLGVSPIIEVIRL